MKLFNSIKIRTPESVELEFALAGVGGRAVALAIDYTVLSAGLLLLLWLMIFILSQLSGWDALLSIDTDTLQLWTIALFSVVLFAGYVGYFIAFETLWYGQTPGKRYARIRVIRDDAQPMRAFQATLRSLVRPVDDILFVGFFFIVFGRQEKRIGDWLAGTLVVQSDPKSVNQAIEVLENSKKLGIELGTQMSFESVSPDDFAIIRDYLQRRNFLTPAARKDVGGRLASQLKAKTNLAKAPMNMTADSFLEAIYWGYQNQRK